MTRTSPTRRTRRRLAGLVAVVTVAAAGLLPVTSVMAADPPNMVLAWNENAVNVISQPASAPGLGQGPPLSALHVAMVQGAIYDAVNAIDRGHKPYLPGLSAPSGASQAAAVAQAAHDVLIGITPATNTAVRDRIDDMLTASLGLIDTSRKDGRHHHRRRRRLPRCSGTDRRWAHRRRTVRSERRPWQVAPRGAAQRERARAVCNGQAAHPEEPGSVPDRKARLP